VIENIDIGGPSMVRSAAKNHAYVAIVTDAGDYPALLEQLDAAACERLAQLCQSGLVRYGQEGALDRDELGHGRLSWLAFARAPRASAPQGKGASTTNRVPVSPSS